MNATNRGSLQSGACVLSLLLLGALGCERSTGNALPPPVFPDVGRDEAVGTTGGYYSQRLRSSAAARSRTDPARLSIDEHELAWTKTAQDARSALMVSPDTGFHTWGVETSVAEIPAGWHTGMHHHGEEAIYIVGGSGLAVVAGRRYDFRTGTTLGIPYGAEHQLYNTGEDVVRYISATPYPLERFVGIGDLVQLAEAGPTQSVPDLPGSEDGYDESGRLIRLLWEDAEHREVSIGITEVLRARLRADVWLTRPNTDGRPKASGKKARLATSLGHHGARVGLMNAHRAARFPNRLVHISGFLVDEPGARSGRHAHMDAILYVVRGSGYSVIGGKRVDWQAGTSIHIPGPRTEHQHFNTGNETSYLLRTSSGLRPELERAVADALPYLWFESRGRIDQTEPTLR